MNIKESLLLKTLLLTILVGLLGVGGCVSAPEKNNTTAAQNTELHKTGLTVDYWAEQAIQLCVDTHRQNNLLSVEQYAQFLSTNSLIRIKLIPRLSYFDIAIYPSKNIKGLFAACRVLHEDGSIARIMVSNPSDQQSLAKEVLLKKYDVMGGLDKTSYNEQLKKAIKIDLSLSNIQKID